MTNVEDKMELPKPSSDLWYEWLTFKRDGNTPSIACKSKIQIEGYADRVLDFAQIVPPAILVDVGSGTGAVALRAIERFGTDIRVIMLDTSRPMLRYCRERATQLGVVAQCEFLLASAEHFPTIPDQSVDAVTSRAVLAYVADKSAAFQEAFRILRPGGWLSVCEPVMQDDALAVVALNQRLNGDGEVPDRKTIELLHRFKSSQYPNTMQAVAESPLTNYTERDLVTMAIAAGFLDAHMELHIDVELSAAVSWATFLQGSPHPLSPTCGEILQQRFSEGERQLLEKIIRPGLEIGNNISTSRVAYLSCRKPSDSISTRPC